MTEVTVTEYQVWREPVGDGHQFDAFSEKMLGRSYNKAEAEEDRIDHDDMANDKADYRRIVIREAQVTLTIENYREGIDRNKGCEGHYPKVSHTYAMMSDGELWPMCGYGWNRSNGERFSILRQVPGSRGACKICAKRIVAGKPPVLDGFKHKTRWL